MPKKGAFQYWNRFILSRLLLLFVLVFVLLISGVFSYTRAPGPARVEAAAASELNFQARLYNSSGSIVPDGNYNLEFNLYTASSGGSSQWTETYTGGNRVRVVNGYMSVYLGSLTSFPGSINWDQEHWITMNVGGAGGTPAWDGEMTPRLKLTAVPYAFQSQQAERLTKLDGANTGILDFLSLSANRTISLPDASGIVCLEGDPDCVDVITTGDTATTSSNSGLEIDSDGLRLLGGCADGQVLAWNDVSEVWECSTAAAGGGVTVRESDGSPALAASTIEFGPASNSDTEFIITNEGGGVSRIRIGTSILTTNNYTTTLNPTYVNTNESPASGDISGSFAAGLTINANSVALGGDTTGDFVQALGTLTGLSTSGNSGEGSTPTLSVLYGSAANTAVQGNTTLVCASGTGDLSGGGNTITLGAGGTCNSITISEAPTFDTSVTTPLLTYGGALTIETTATGGADDIIFEAANTEIMRILESGNIFFEKGTNDVTIAVNTPGAPATYTFSGATGMILTTANYASNLDATYVNVGESPAAGDISGSFSAGLSVDDVQNNAVDLGVETVGDYVQNLGTLTGLSTSGNSGEGSTPGLSVLYGATANSAVQGNTTLVCPSGTGDLSGGGNTITLGTGGTCNNITISEAPVFDTSVTSPLFTNAGALTIRTTATGGADDILFQTAGAEVMRILENGNLFFEKGTNDVTVTFTTPGSPATYTFSGATGTVLTTGNYTGTLDSVYVNVGESPAAGDVSGSFSGGLLVSNVQNNSVDLGTDTVGDYVQNLGTLTGLATSGNSGEGSTPTLSVLYGSSANTAVQGNTTIVCPSGTGDLSGGGGTITLGAGGTCNNITISEAPVFDTSVTSPLFTGSGAVTVSSGGSGGLTLDSASNTLIIASNDTVLQRTAAGSYTIDLNDAGATTLVLNNSGVGAASLNLQDGALQVAGTVVLTNARVLQNVTANTSILTSGVLGVARGGTGAGTFTAGGILFGNGTGAFTNSGVLTNGQLLIGDGSGAPTVGTLTAGSGISIVNGAGTITISNSLGTSIGNSEIEADAVTLGAQTTGDYVQALGTLTGLGTSGNSGEGSTPGLSVLYGSTANTAAEGNTQITATAGTGLSGGGTITLGSGGSVTFDVDYGSTAGTAVQGNTTIVCPSGTGDLSGGGNTITLGTGGTCNTITISESPVFNTSVTTPLLTYGGALTIETTATGGADDIIFEAANVEIMRILETGNIFFEKGTNDVTIAINTPGAPATYAFDGASGTILTSANYTSSLDATYVNTNESPAAGDVSGSFSAGLSVNSVQNNSVDLGTDTVGDYVQNLGTLTGLSTSGNSGESSTPGLSVLYGATSNTAVQGNTQITCASGTGNLNGGGTVITLGTGGTCATINTNNAVTFSSSVTTPLVTSSGALTVSSTGSNALTLTSGSGLVTLNASSIATTGGLAFNLANASTVTFSIDNSGAGAANLNLVDGVLQTAGTTRLTNAGALQNITTLGLSGAITGATSGNTINGLVINSGALSGITGVTFTSGALNLNNGGITNTGSIAGATTINASGLITGTAGLTVTGGVVNLNASSNNAVNIGTGTSTGAVSIGGGSNALTIDSTNFDVASNGNVTLTGNLQLSGDANEGISGGGLTDCDGGNSRLTWDASTNKFGCNTMTTRSFIDSTADTVADNSTTNYWDLAAENGNSYPNLTLSSSANEIFGIVTMEVTQTSGSGDIESVAAIRRTIDGSVPACSSTQIGANLGVFTTTTNAQAGTSVSFIDTPGTTANPARYTICSDPATNIPGGLGGNSAQITRLRVSLFEVNNAADLAEIYPSQDLTISAGEVVSLDPDGRVAVHRSGLPYDNTAIGVVATNPALLMGGTDGESSHGVPVALAGRVPVKVTAANGAITKGDLLTSSHIPGVAMRATKTGATIGVAMEDFNGEGVGTVMMFIQTGQSGGIVDTSKPSRELLEDLIAARAGLIDQNFGLSQINADVITAGLELITPRVTTDVLATNGIEVDEGGLLFNDVSGEQIASIDQLGNAHFGSLVINGTLEAGTIRADHIEGLDYVGQINDIEERLTSLEDRVRAAENNQSQSIDLNNLTVGSLTANGEARFNEGVTLEKDAEIKGSLEVDLDLIANGAVQVYGQANFKDTAWFERDLFVVDNLDVDGITNLQGLVVDLDLISKGALVVEGEATFKEAVKFMSDVEIGGNLTLKGQTRVGEDTAGVATIEAGKTVVKVEFKEKQGQVPFISLTLGEGKFAQYSYRNVTKDGFEIVIAAPSLEPLEFSWIAIQRYEPEEE